MQGTRVMALVALVVALVGCRGGGFGAAEDGDLLVTVTFDDVAGLKPGDNVQMRGVAIGVVRDTRLVPDGVEVELAIAGTHAPAVTEGARFVIDTEKLVAGKMCVRVEPGRAGAPPLASGVAVKGDGVRTLLSQAGPLIDHSQAALAEAGGAVVEDLGRRAEEAVDNVIDPGTSIPRTADPALVRGKTPELVFEPISARIATRKHNGKKWDATETNPDVILSVAYGGTIVLQEPSDEDGDPQETHTPVWSSTSRPFPYRPEGAVIVQVMDDDLSFSDMIGQGKIPLPPPDQIGREETASFGQVEELRYRFRRADR